MINDLLDRVSEAVWGPWTVFAILLAGLFLSAQNRFFQISAFKTWLKETAGQLFKRNKSDSITPAQSSLAALAGTLGTGNIVGVASALAMGGPGSILWMWIAAILGMMTSYGENVLGMLYRTRDAGGNRLGGPMLYLENGLGAKKTARVFAVICALSAFAMGNMTQTGAIADSTQKAFGISPVVTGITVSLLAAPAVLGGVAGAVRLTEKLVPFMAGAYMLACLAVITVNYRALPEAVSSIFRCAFTPSAAGGGVLAAMLTGVRRGIFTNEAGLGTAVIVHCSAETENPVTQGMWGMFEVFADTIVVCTLTALAMLTAKTDIGNTFSCIMGNFSDDFVSLSLALFAFVTIIAWSCYGERVVVYLFGTRAAKPFRILYILAPLPGAVLGLSGSVALSDILNAAMCFINITAVLLLSGKIRQETRRYFKR